MTTNNTKELTNLMVNKIKYISFKIPDGNLEDGLGGRRWCADLSLDPALALHMARLGPDRDLALYSGLLLYGKLEHTANVTS